MKSNLKILTQEKITATASGKTILIGEHSVVYGHKAIAMALPDIQLKITLEPFCEKNPVDNWNSAWKTFIQEKPVEMEERITHLLTHALEKSLLLMQYPVLLNQIIPQKITIHSQIPLGGGMGGSAAISTCLVRIAAQIANKNLSFDNEIQFANEVDSLFHNGKASGLDVSAVASNGMILFQKGKHFEKINNKCSFWLALVDSGERSKTSSMIEKVRNLWEANTENTEMLFKKLNSLSIACKNNLEYGDTLQLATNINEAHNCLVALGVSTLKMDNLVQELKTKGALGAKLTGAGGGGLVLGLFSKEPEFLKQIYGNEKVYITKVNPI